MQTKEPIFQPGGIVRLLTFLTTFAICYGFGYWLYHVVPTFS